MLAVKQLYDLQEIDLRYAALEKSQAEVRAKLADDSALPAARERLEELQTRLKELDSKRRVVDGSITQLQERVKGIESKLYGGAVTSPRELTAAEEERSFTSAQQKDEEEKLLEIMVEIEDVQSVEQEAQEALTLLESERPAEMTELLEEDQTLTKQLAELGKSREEAAPQVQSKALSVYESLRKTKNGYAVARVERGMCQGCRLALSTMQLQRARGSQEIVQCSSCNRILYAV